MSYDKKIFKQVEQPTIGEKYFVYFVGAKNKAYHADWIGKEQYMGTLHNMTAKTYSFTGPLGKSDKTKMTILRKDYLLLQKK